MPDFKELVKNLYATKGRELTEEKLSYIETNYGKGKEEEFVKNFYATIGEELPQEKFDYIRDTYLKKKEDGGIPYRTPSAPVAPSFGTPSVVEASEQLESQSKLTPPRIKGVSVKSPLEGIKGAPPPTTEYGLIPEGKEKKKSLFEIEKLPSESNASIERLNQNAELQTKLLNDPSYALLSDSDEKRKKIYTEKNKAVAEQRNQTLDELYSDMDEYLADFLPENDKKEYTGLRDRVDLLKKINQAKVNGQPTENLEKQYDEMVTAFSEAKAKRISDADSQIKQLRLSLEETPVQEQQPILDEIRLLEASKKPFFTDKKQAAAQIVMQEGLQGNKSDQEKLREYAHALMRERSDLREMLGMKGARRTIGESVVDMTIGGDDAVLQRLTDVETKLKSIAPIVLINETPLVEKEGALKVLGKEFMGSLAPTTKAIIPTQQSVAQNTLQGLELAGVDLNNISKEAISTIEKTSKPYEDWSAKDFAQMSGTTFGFMPKFVIASAVTEGVGGLSAVSPYWRSIKILAERGSLGNKVNNNVLAALQANKYGRGFLKTAFSGVEFGIQSEVESRIFQADKDEVNAVTGGTGGTLGKIFGIGIEKASNITSKAFSTVMTSLFGNKSIDATNKVLNFAKTAYSKTKTVNEKAVGEVGEETGESLANLYQESENGQQFFDKVAEQYGDVSKGLKFFLSTYMMGAAFGSGTYFGRWSTNKSAKLYNDLSPKEKAVADNIISDIRQEQNKAETDAAIDAIKESDLPEDKKDELIKDANKQGEIINNVIEDKANASELEQFAPTEKEQIKEEYDRAKEPIIGRTDVTQEGLGVATETGTQGVTREGVPSEEVDAGSVVGEEDLDSKIKRLDELSALGNNEYFNNADEIEFLKKEIGDATMQKYLANGWNDDAYVKVEIDRFNKLFSEQAKKQVGGKNAIIPQIVSVKRSEKRTTKSGIEIGDDKEWDIKFNTGGDYGVGYDKSMGNPYTAMMQSWLNEFHSKNKSIKYRESVEGRDNLTWEQLKNYNPLPKQEAVEQPLKATEEKVSDALKDVESTARALGKIKLIDDEKIRSYGSWKLGESKQIGSNEVNTKLPDSSATPIEGNYKLEVIPLSSTDYFFKKDSEGNPYLSREHWEFDNEDGYQTEQLDMIKKGYDTESREPIIVETSKDGLHVVVDGHHRLTIAKELGKKSILALVRNYDGKEVWGGKNDNYTFISEAYHKAKADGSNPELITSVETLLGKPKEGVPSEEVRKEVVEAFGDDAKDLEDFYYESKRNGTNKEFVDEYESMFPPKETQQKIEKEKSNEIEKESNNKIISGEADPIVSKIVSEHTFTDEDNNLIDNERGNLDRESFINKKIKEIISGSKLVSDKIKKVLAPIVDKLKKIIIGISIVSSVGIGKQVSSYQPINKIISEKISSDIANVVKMPYSDIANIGTNAMQKFLEIGDYADTESTLGLETSVDMTGVKESNVPSIVEKDVIIGEATETTKDSKYKIKPYIVNLLSDSVKIKLADNKFKKNRKPFKDLKNSLGIMGSTNGTILFKDASDYQKSLGIQMVYDEKASKIVPKMNSDVAPNDIVFLTSEDIAIPIEDLDMKPNNNGGFDIKKGKDNENGTAILLKKDGNSFHIGWAAKADEAPSFVSTEKAKEFKILRGGMVWLYSTDGEVAVAVSGSLNDIFSEYKRLQEKNPNKKFILFRGDTGSYSTPAFTETNETTADDVSKYSTRNTYGNNVHLVLMKPDAPLDKGLPVGEMGLSPLLALALLKRKKGLSITKEEQDLIDNREKQKQYKIQKEYATQEVKQPKGVRTEPEGGIKGGETKTPSVSDSVQRTKESEKEKVAEGGVTAPTPEGSTTTLPPRIKGGSERVMVFKDGEWQERVGRETTKVSEKVKAEAQEAFAKPVSVKEKKKSDDVADSILQGLGVVEGDATMSVIESVRNALAETGIEIKVIENQDEYNKEAQKRGAGEDTEGMFVSDEGVIYINKNKIKDLWGDTIIFHEGTHPVINIIRNTNPKLFEKIVQGARELGNKYKSVADVLKFAEQYRMDVVENEDGNFDVVDKEGNIMATFDSEEKANAFVESKIADEFVTEIIARIASGKIQIEGLPKTLLQSIIDIMNKIFEALGVDTRITDTAPFAFKRKAEEIADALKSGRGISDIVGKENVKEYMNQMFSPEVILGGDIKKGAISQSRITNEPVINVYQSKEVEKLEVKTLDEIYDEYNGKAVVINSDPTRVGFLKLPSGKTIFMYGGPAYLSIKDNVDGSVGFATTQISKVNTWNKYFKQLFGNKKGVTLVATQTPLSMLSNSYALRYVMDAISTLPKSVLKSYEFKNEFFGKNLVALKNAFGEKAYNDFVKKYKNADLSNPNIIDGMISEMAYKIGDDNKPASFKARGKFVSNLLAGIDLKSKSKTIEGDVGYYSKKPNKYIAKELFERLGLNTEKLLYELGEKELIDLYIKQGKWGFAVSGFETSPKISIELVQSKGVKHPLFNAKFPSSNSFLLDGAYEINKLFKPIEMEAPKGGVYTKTAAQMLAGSMYVKGEGVEKEGSFEYSKVAPSYKRVQASKGGREEITLTDGRTVETKPLDVEVVNGFYSPIEKNVKEYGKDKIKAKDWLNVVGKGDEAVFTGVRAFLEGKDPNAMVSKQEILDYMKENRISVVEVVKGVTTDIFDYEQALRLYDDGVDLEGYDYETDSWSPVLNRKSIVDDFVIWRASSAITSPIQQTEFSQYQLEGEKENYKEVLVTLPSKTPSFSEWLKSNNKKFSEENQKEYELKYGDLSDRNRITKFKSTHFDEPNILVHLRMNTRMGTWEVKKGDKFIDGNGNLVVATENTTQSGKVLFLEEVQSDWGQTGKKKGFKDAKKLEDLKNQRQIILDKTWNEGVESITPEEQLKFEELEREINNLLKIESQGVPTAPFVMDTNAWTKLGLKVALKEAVKQGADKIAWTTGEQQNERYDLSKQVDEMFYQKLSNGKYQIDANKNGNIVFTREFTEQELPNFVGKEVADKIVKNEGKFISKSPTYAGESVDKYSLKGEDLVIGGKGMKGFYGSIEEGTKGIVGGVAEKVFGQKVGKTDIIQQKGDVWEDNKGNWNVTTVDAQGNENTTKFSDKRGAESYANLNKFTVSQPSIDVTPALRAEVQRGLAQFSLGGRENVINKIKDSIKNLREQGFSDSDIIEGLNKIKDQIGLTDADIKDIVKGEEKISDAKEREVQNNRALSYGYKNIYHALNSVNKETGESYEKLSDVPDSVLEEVAKKKAKIETPKGKRRFTQQFIKQYPELAEMLSEDIVNYAKMPNNISVDMANAFIEEVGLEEARAAFADMSSGLPSGARMTLGQLVIKKLEEAGRVDEAIDVLEQVTTRATEMGQEIQALSMWAFLTPQGQLRYAQKTVNKAVERRKKQDKSKTDKLKEKLKKANQETVDETLQDPKVRGLIEKTDSIIPKGLPTPETKKPKKYIVSDDRVAFLKKQIKGKLFSGIPAELIELGVAYVERGAYKFSDFSRAMIKEFGNKIKPYLKEVYTKATETLIKEDYDKSNFDSADNIDKQVAQQKADEAVEKVEKAIKAGNKKALAQAIVNLQKVAKQNGLWGQYKKYAVSRLKQLTIQNISDDVKKNPPLDEFTKGLVQNIKSMMMEKAEPKEREKIAKRPAIEVIADAFKNPEAYKEVLEETQKEMRKKYKDDVESLEMLDEYFGEFFDKPFSSKLVGTAIKEAMKEMNITISDIVTSHYTVYDATKKSLVDKLVEQAGLSESEASVLAKAIEKEFDKIATEKKQKLLEKILSNKKRKTPEAKSLEQELIRLTNLGAFSDSDVMSKWAEKMGYPKLTQEQVKEIQKLADAVQRAGKGFERFRAIEDLLSYQANLKGVSQLDVAISIWYANILSGRTTQIINTVANLLNAATLYANAVAQNPKNAKFIASGFIEGFKRGLIEAKETFRTGYSPIRGKVEVPPVLERVKFEGFYKPLEYAKLIGRLMKAADVLVFEALKEMRAYQLAAKQAAKTSALEPSQSIKDKAAEILGKTDYMIEEATETAELWYENKVEEINESNLSKEEKEKALKQAKIDKQRKLYEYLEEQRSPEFQSEVSDYAARGTYNYKPEGVLGWIASAINQAKDKLNIAAEDATNPFQQAAINTAKVFTNAIVPFTNIIANVANESLNYTPVGIARRISGTTALTYNKKELTDQQKVDLMTKAIIGNSLMVAIYLLATLPAGDDDEPVIEITANGTGDYRKNYELQANGWQPYSIRVGKKWISYQYTPFMIPLSFIGNIKDYEKYRGEKLTDMAFGNQAAVAFSHTFRALLDMTALSSLNKFLSAALDPRNENKVEDLLKAAEKTATSVVVPNFFTQSAKDIESAFQIPLKETSDQRFGNVLQHIPYVRNKYYDKLNALGEPIMPDTDKFLSTSKDEPIWGLIANKKAFIGKPSIKQMKRIDAETGQERFYTQEEYYNYGAIRGALIKEAIIKDFDKINAMSDKDAQEYIGSIKNEANMIARLAAESGKDEQSRSKIIETTKKSLEKDKAEKAKSEERKKKEEAKMSPQQIKYMNELDAISSKAGKIQYIINLKEKSGTTWYNVKKDIRKVISNDLIKDLKDLEKEGAIPKLGIAIKEKFD